MKLCRETKNGEDAAVVYSMCFYQAVLACMSELEILKHLAALTSYRIRAFVGETYHNLIFKKEKNIYNSRLAALEMKARNFLKYYIYCRVKLFLLLTF